MVVTRGDITNTLCTWIHQTCVTGQARKTQQIKTKYINTAVDQQSNEYHNQYFSKVYNFMEIYRVIGNFNV